MPAANTIEQMISRFNDVHHHKYTYDKFVYTTMQARGTVTCPQHGDFLKNASKHIYAKEGCPMCSKLTQQQSNRKFQTFEDVVQRCNTIHKNRYQYIGLTDNTMGYNDLINTDSKLYIVCSVHGEFVQTINKHIYAKTGCPKCFNKRRSLNRLKTKETFIKDSINVHGNKYQYTDAHYMGAHTNVSILCSVHGSFSQTPANHILKRAGCPQCAFVHTPEERTRLTAAFVVKASEVHNNRYRYTNTVWNGADTKLEVTCCTHGPFTVLPFNHTIRKSGCPKCDASKGELAVSLFLSKHNIVFEQQKQFLGCVSKRNLSFDFYVPIHNLLIEYDGEQHFGPVRINGISSSQADAIYERNILHDDIKTQFANDNGIRLLRIPYTRLKEVDVLLTEWLVCNTHTR